MRSAPSPRRGLRAARQPDSPRPSAVQRPGAGLCRVPAAPPVPLRQGRLRGREMTPAARAEILVRVQPRASRNEVAGERDGRILIRVTAPPAEGRANDAVVAAARQAPRGPQVERDIVAGHAARDKRIEIEGVTTTEAIKRLRRPARRSVERAATPDSERRRVTFGRTPPEVAATPSLSLSCQG